MLSEQVASNALRPLLATLDRTCLIIGFDAHGRGVRSANRLALDMVRRDIGSEDTAEQILCGIDHDLATIWAAALEGRPAALRCGLKTSDDHTARIIGDLVFCPDDDAGDQVVLVARSDPQAGFEMLELVGRCKAIDRSQAIVAFDLSGHILEANANFLAVMGCTLAQIQGKHHSMFCDEATSSSVGYEDFWERLRNGGFVEDEFKRRALDGREVWIRASYNPIFDQNGKTIKIVEYAMDVTTAKQRAAETLGKVTAIERAQAVIEFDLTGKVLRANPTFLDLMGYTEDEIVGGHHRMFCTTKHVNSFAYKQF